MTIIATSGFSTKNMSIGFFDSVGRDCRNDFYDNLLASFYFNFQSVRKGTLEILGALDFNFFYFLRNYYFSCYVLAKKNYEVDYLQSLKLPHFL